MTLPHSPDDLASFSLAEVDGLSAYVIEEIARYEDMISGWLKLKGRVEDWQPTYDRWEKFRRELFQLRDEDLPAARLRIAKAREPV